jgi:hypothetical protein
MNSINPTLEWYTSISEKYNFPPRCPFASAYRCPRYYQSRSLLGESGISTSIDAEEDKRLLEKWKESDLWPITREQATSVSGSSGNYNFSHFCPEVSFEIFRLFASALTRYPDDSTKNMVYSTLADATDWRWQWWHIQPMHYSQCPLFSPLSSNPIQISRRQKRSIGF